VFNFLASNGTGVNLLKLGTKRRRTKAQIQQEREEAAFKQEADERKDLEIQRLMAEL
jgi:hypothetical protein